MCLDRENASRIAASTKGTKCVADICKSLCLNIAPFGSSIQSQTIVMGVQTDQRTCFDCFEPLEM